MNENLAILLAAEEETPVVDPNDVEEDLKEDEDESDDDSDDEDEE